MYTNYLGIDPGLSGYAVLLDAEGQLVERFKTPTKKEKKKTVLDDEKMDEILKKIPKGTLCAIERQHVIPFKFGRKQGAGSSGKTMYGYGLWVGLLRGNNIDYRIIGAKEWQKVYLDPNIEDSKEASVVAAKKWKEGIDLRRTPKCKIDDHNFSDAICIARYAHDKLK